MALTPHAAVDMEQRRCAPHDEQGGTAECGDERQTVPVEHERLPVADNLVLVISLLGNPEIAEKTSHLKADAVREPKRFTMATRHGRAARSERRRISTNPVRSRWCGHRARG